MTTRGSDDTARRGHETIALPAPHRRRSVGLYALLFLALAFLVDGVAGERGWVANRRAQQEYERAVQARDELRRENAALAARAASLKHDAAAVEELARRELGMLKPGEKVFIVRDAPRPVR